MIIKAGAKLWEFVFKRGPITTDNAKGFCQDPVTKGKQIVIKIGLDPYLELDTIIHELNHAQNWGLDEEFVNRNATETKQVLKRLGWAPLFLGEEISTKRCSICHEPCEPIPFPKQKPIMLCHSCVKIIAENSNDL